MTSKSRRRLPEAQAPRTVEMVQADLLRAGISVTEWARQHGINRQVVFDLLRRKLKGRRGQAHAAAVLLGLKEGNRPKGHAGD